MNISSAILAPICKCVSDFKQNGKQPWESLALSASSPKSPEYTICPFEQALYVQMAACKPECAIFVLNNRFSKGALKWERPPGTVSKGKQKNEVKIKIETMARHDQMEHNIKVDRHPKEKTIINQHMSYLKELNCMSSILPPLYAKIHRSTSFSVSHSLSLSDH